MFGRATIRLGIGPHSSCFIGLLCVLLTCGFKTFSRFIKLFGF